MPADIICSEKRTLSFEEQIITNDKYLSIFSSQMEAIVEVIAYYPSNLFRNTRNFEDTEE